MSPEQQERLRIADTLERLANAWTLDRKAEHRDLLKAAALLREVFLVRQLKRYGPQFDRDNPQVFNGMRKETLGDWVRFDELEADLAAAPPQAHAVNCPQHAYSLWLEEQGQHWVGLYGSNRCKCAAVPPEPEGKP